MKKFLLASAAAAVMTMGGSAFAADVIDEVAVYDWSGFYLGVHAGYGWADADQTDPGSSDFDTDAEGFVGGGQIGFNWQLAPIVLGIEADASFADLDDTADLGFFEVEQEVDMLASVRARLGFAADRLMPYVTVGWGMAEAERSREGFLDDSDKQTHDGLVYGGGLEYAWTDSFTVRAEYLHYDLGKQKYDLGFISPKVDLDVDVIRLGANFKF